MLEIVGILSYNSKFLLGNITAFAQPVSRGHFHYENLQLLSGEYFKYLEIM